MDFLTGLVIYLVVAVSLSLTSYLTIFRPSIDLLEEILEQKTVYSGVLGFLIWNICATVVSPWTLLILLSNRNTETSEKFAVSLAEALIDEEEE